MSKASEKASEKADAIQTLKRMGVKPGATVYTSVTQVARSGMSRHIRCYIVTRDTRSGRDGKKHVEHGITDITGLVATACGFTRASGSHWDLVIGGCGMDMAWHVCYTLGRVMFPNGGPLAQSTAGRRAQEEQAAKRDKRAAAPTEPDGGYLLNKRDL